jgi:protein-S-isoprenylcysteine O-methyltransferase Ste14
MTFDPFAWAERHVAGPTLHRAIRYAAAVLCAGFLLHRVLQFPLYRNAWLWAAETAVYAVVLLAYLLRADPKERSRGASEILLPAVATLLPFTLLFTPVHPRVLGTAALQDVIFWVMAAATAFAVWGLWNLRRCFSITVEARGVVGTGPYRFVRHPVYLGEIIAAAAVASWRFSLVNVFLWSCFVALQLARARLEERKLSAAFPGYSDCARRTWWFWSARA